MKVCPIRGHKHVLTIERWLTQDGTGNRAVILACPKGRWHFLQTEDRYNAGQPVSNLTRFVPSKKWKREKGIA